MKIDVTQFLDDMEGQPQRFGVSREMNLLFQNIMSELERVTDKETVNKVLDGIEKGELFPEKVTLRNVLMGSLMSSEDTNLEQKIKDYKLLRKISDEDEPDLDESTRDKLLERVGKAYSNIVTVGKAHDLLKPISEQEPTRKDE